MIRIIITVYQAYPGARLRHTKWAASKDAAWCRIREIVCEGCGECNHPSHYSEMMDDCMAARHAYAYLERLHASGVTRHEHAIRVSHRLARWIHRREFGTWPSARLL